MHFSHALVTNNLIKEPLLFMMNKKNYLFTLLIIYLGLSTLCLALPSPTLRAEGAVLLEAHTGKVLYAKNPSSRFYPASTTKVLTTLLLAETFDHESILTKSESSRQNVPLDSSYVKGLGFGDMYSYKDALYAILMSSDNYVSYDMAMHTAGSIEAFANLMNEKAESLGAYNSHFVNPHGYHDPNHYTTPYDLALITQAAFANPIVEQIAGTPTHDLTVLNTDTKIPLTHTAAFFKEDSSYYNPHVVAAKTGYHTPAGRTLVTKATYDDLELIAVVMRSDYPTYFEDINKLLDYGSANFTLTTSDDGHATLQNISYSPWAKSSVEHASQEGIYMPTLVSYMDTSTPHTLYTMLEKTLPIDDLESTVHYTAHSPALHQQPLTLSQAQEVLDEVAETRGIALPANFVQTTLASKYTTLPTTVSLEASIYLQEVFRLFLLTTDSTYTSSFLSQQHYLA